MRTFIVVLFLSACPAIAAYAAEAVVPWMNYKIVQEACGYNSWPMIQAVNGRLCCAYSRGAAHSIGEGRRGVWTRVSSDGGTTWSAESLVADNPDVGEVTVGKGLDADGAMLLWVRSWGKDRHHDLYRSTDGIRFKKIASPKLDPVPMQICDVFAVPEVGLMSLWFSEGYRADADRSWGTLTSADGGRTWTRTTVESGLAREDWPTEPSGVSLGGGRILVVARSEGAARHQFQMMSTDAGKTWRKYRTNINDVAESTPSLVFDPKTGLVSNYYYQRGARKLKCRVAEAAAIFDHPTAWPPPVVHFEGKEARAFDAGNVNATELNGMHYVATYTGTTSDTAVVVVTVPAPARKLTRDEALRTWRCEAKNVDIRLRPEWRGRPNALEIRYPADERTKKGSLDFACFSIREMLDAWIPPYVGMRAHEVRLSVWPIEVGKGSDPVLRYRFLPKWKSEEWRKTEHSGWLSALTAGMWNDLSFSLDPNREERLSDVSLLFEGSAKAAFLVAGLSLVLDDGSRYDLMNGDAPRYRIGMDKPLSTVPVKLAPKRPRIQFGVGGLWCPVYGEGSVEIGAYMAKYLPEYDIVLSLDGAPDPAALGKMRLAPTNVFWQVQGGRHGLAYPACCDALVRDWNGCVQSFRFNSAVGTHPLFRDSYEDQIAYFGSLGVNSVQRYDYVWYYPKGPSGFDEASVASFREDLSGTDEGLLLAADGKRPERRIRFWDYYEDYYGNRLTPADRGLVRWQDYRPKCGTDDEKAFHAALVAYEWLRLAQRFGEWSSRYCFGASYDFLLNGEGNHNGNDHVYLSRLKHTGIVSPEFFSGTMKSLGGIYHGSGRYLRNARACGKPFGITVEQSRGAGKSQPYWSTKTGYAVCYFLSALGYNGFEFDSILPSMSWQDYTHHANPFFGMELALAMADARGYRQAKRDGARPRQTDVFLLVERCVAGVSKRAFLGTDADDMRRELNAEELVYEMTDPQELADVLGSARVIFCSLERPRPDVMARLERWRSEAPGRVVVTERQAVRETAERLGLARLQKPQPDGCPAWVAPFDCTVGSVALLANRRACAEANRDEWYEKVWRPAYGKCTYDYRKLLYHDRCPGANVAAEVKVPEDGFYRVYYAVRDAEERVSSRDGWLKLTLGDALVEVCYYGPDTPASRAFIEKVREDRKVSDEFLAVPGARFSHDGSRSRLNGTGRMWRTTSPLLQERLRGSVMLQATGREARSRQSRR